MQNRSSLCQEPAAVTPSSWLSESKLWLVSVWTGRSAKQAVCVLCVWFPPPPPGRSEPYFKGVNSFQTSEWRGKHHHPEPRDRLQRAPCSSQRWPSFSRPRSGIRGKKAVPLPGASVAALRRGRCFSRCRAYVIVNQHFYISTEDRKRPESGSPGYSAFCHRQLVTRLECSSRSGNVCWTNKWNPEHRMDLAGGRLANTGKLKKEKKVPPWAHVFPRVWKLLLGF